MADERYEIIKLLGKGRTGGVYEAEDSRLKRKVAMRRFFSQSDHSSVSDYEDDFIAISQNLSALQHPNLLRVYDAGVDSDGAFIISQLLKGDTLHNRLKENPLSAWDVYDLANQMLDALSTSHHGGFVHGAITPGSILMSPRARGGHLYVILDMGLCRLAPLIQGEDSVLSMMADPAILAPELFDGSLADVRADLYMLGHILYMCLAGGHPFAGESLDRCRELHRDGLPPLATYAPDTPPDLINWISWLCMMNPDDRPETAGTALRALPKIPKPATVHATPNSVASPLGTASGPLSTMPAQHQASSLSATTGPLTGNPATAQSAVAPVTSPTGISPVVVDPPKKSKALPFILGGAGLLAVAVGVIIAMSGGGEEGTTTDKDKAKPASTRDAVATTNAPLTPEELAKREAELEKKKHLIGLYINEDDNIDSLTPYETSKKWKAIDGVNISQQKNELAFSDSGVNANPGIKHRFSRSQVNNIFDLGWLVTYKVKAKSGKHIIGWNISGSQNSEWMEDDKAVSWGLSIERSGDDVIVTDQFRNSKSLKLNANGDKEVKITAQCRPGDIEGYYDVYINDKKIWRSRLSQTSGFGSSWNKSFFSASAVDPANAAEWSFSELSMKTVIAD